jgi:hypothetical protein
LRIRSVRAALALAALAALTAAGPAAASEFDQPAPAQYIETLPSSGGPTAPGVGGQGLGKAAPLSASALARLRRGGGSLTAPLEELATSRQFGAPPSQRGLPGRRPVGSIARGDGKSVFGALADTAAPKSGPGGTLWLLLALLAVTAVTAGIAVRNQREARRATG